jgi:hypothetical protein
MKNINANQRRQCQPKRSRLAGSYPRVDRSKISIVELTAPPDAVAYRRSRTPAERLAYMEYLRLINYGEAAVSGRIRKVIEIVRLGSS